MVYKIQPTAKINDIDLTFQCHPRSIVLRSNEKYIYIYKLQDIFHTNFDNKMHHLWDETLWKFFDIDLTFKCIQDQRSRGKLKDNI